MRSSCLVFSCLPKPIVDCCRHGCVSASHSIICNFFLFLSLSSALFHRRGFSVEWDEWAPMWNGCTVRRFLCFPSRSHSMRRNILMHFRVLFITYERVRVGRVWAVCEWMSAGFAIRHETASYHTRTHTSYSVSLSIARMLPCLSHTIVMCMCVRVRDG